jgi:hypothetical protein
MIFVKKAAWLLAFSAHLARTEGRFSSQRGSRRFFLAPMKSRMRIVLALALMSGVGFDIFLLDYLNRFRLITKKIGEPCRMDSNGRDIGDTSDSE